MEEDVKRITKFLDAAAPGWRDEATWPGHLRDRDRERPQGARLPDALAGGQQEAKPMRVDEEQTKRDRQALGFDKIPDDEKNPKPQKTDEELRKEQEELIEARRRDDETRRQQEIEKARADAAAGEKGQIKAADQYADPPGGAMKEPEGDAPAPLASPPGAAGGGKPPVEQTGKGGGSQGSGSKK